MKKALEATARVACCSFLLGTMSCHAKKVSTDQQPSNIEPSKSVERSSPAEEGTKPPEKVSPQEIKYPEELRSCAQKVNKELLVEKKLEPSDEVIGCCYQLADYTFKIEGRLYDWELGDVCCVLMDDGIINACTPWGPPMPPKMTA